MSRLFVEEVKVWMDVVGRKRKQVAGYSFIDLPGTPRDASVGSK